MINDLNLKKSLGSGGIGEAFLAATIDAGEERLFVVKKVPKTAFSKKVDSLRREFVTLSRLAHPNIARVFDFGSDQDSYFLVEEFIDGADLFEATHQVDYNQVLSVLVQLLRALDFMHRRGVLHGDLKAENILVVRNASLSQTDAVKLIDFGLARHLKEVQAHQRPSGTLPFMAPEILLGKPYDHRADLYALGVCLYRILTGRYPFEAQGAEAVRPDLRIQMQIEKRPVEPRCFRADLPRGLNTITMRLLQKSPGDRFQTAADALESLNREEKENFTLWTDVEAHLTLREGPLFGREKELRRLKELYEAGARRLRLVGGTGMGKKRLAHEFGLRLQEEGHEERPVFLMEPGDGSEGVVEIAPWSEDEVAGFLEDRLRLERVPKDWRKNLIPLTEGTPQKAIVLAEYWLAAGWSSRPLADFKELSKAREALLAKDKRKVFELCAFAAAPLTQEVLEKISGLSPSLLQAALDGLEKEGWLLRTVHQGLYHYRAAPEHGARPFEIPEAGSFLSFIHLIEETYRAGQHLRAARLLDGLLGTLNEKRRRDLPRETAAALYATASLVFLEIGRLRESASLCREFLNLPGLTDTERGKILNRLGWIAYREGDYRRAHGVFEEAAPYWEKAGDRRGQASVANFQGMTHQALLEWDPAVLSYRRALSLLLESDDPWRPLFRMNLAVAAQETRDFSEALVQYEAAREECRADRHFEARLLNQLANLYLFLGRYDQAGRLVYESLRISVESGIASLEGANYLLLSVLSDREGRFDACRDYVQKAAALFERLGTAAERAAVGLHEAYYWFTVGDGERALKALSSLRKDFPGEATIGAQADLLEAKIEARTLSSDPSRAETALERARTYFESRNDPANLWDVFFVRAEIKRRQDPKRAQKDYRKALEILEDLAAKIPEEFRSGFFRDRKRERILAALTKEEPLRTQAPITEIARINRLIASEHNLDTLLELILDQSLELLQAERGFILLDEGGRFRIRASRNIDRGALESSVDPSGNPEPSESRYSVTIARQAATGGRSVLVVNAAGDERFREAASVIDLHLQAVLAVPMKVGAEVLGVVYVDNRFSPGAFDEDHQRVLEAFADQAALALRNARQVEEIRARQRELEDSRRQIEELNALLRLRLNATEEELASIQKSYRKQQEDLQSRYAYDQIIGKSPRLKDVLRVIDRVTASDVPVLLMGEAGTGKELLARTLHFNGPRKDRPFAAEDCASLSERLLERELFGDAQGSGIFEAASGGTVFLNSIGNLSVGLQAKLLQALQDRMFRPVGFREAKGLDVRLVVATDRDLGDLVSEGKFLQDLYERLRVVAVTLPTLRERAEDIPILVENFLKRSETGTTVSLAPKAMEGLIHYNWPGNVRELENEIRRCVALGKRVIGAEDLSARIVEDPRASLRQAPLTNQVGRLEKSVILATLKKHHQSRVKAAQTLGVSRFTLYKKMKAYGIPVRKNELS